MRSTSSGWRGWSVLVFALVAGCGSASRGTFSIEPPGAGAGGSAGQAGGEGGRGGSGSGGAGAGGVVMGPPGACCEAVFTAGCPASAAVEACVCEGDPYCCETRWDAACARSAIDRCGGSCSGGSAGAAGPGGAGGAGSAGAAGVAGGAGAAGAAGAAPGLCTVVTTTPGCPASPVIEACVCADDPSCCLTKWDSICVGKVSSLHCDPLAPIPACGFDIVTADTCEFKTKGGTSCDEAMLLGTQDYFQGMTAGFGKDQGSCGGGDKDPGKFCGNGGEAYFRYPVTQPKTMLRVRVINPGADPMSQTNVCALPLDAVVYVRTTCSDPKTELACHAMGPEDEINKLAVKIPSPGDVFIIVDGRNGDVGRFNLQVNQSPYCDVDADCPDGQHCVVAQSACSP